MGQCVEEILLGQPKEELHKARAGGKARFEWVDEVGGRGRVVWKWSRHLACFLPFLRGSMQR